MEAVDRACLEMWHNVQAWLGYGESSLLLVPCYRQTLYLYVCLNDQGGKYLREYEKPQLTISRLMMIILGGFQEIRALHLRCL